jgi:hypothetical protein
VYESCPLLHNCLRFHRNDPIGHSSLANFRCPKCIQMHCDHLVLLDDRWFVWFSSHVIFEFILHGGP